MILAVLTGLALAAEAPAPPPDPGLPSPAPELRRLDPAPPDYVEAAGELDMTEQDWTRWRRGRRAGLAGIFLGWAGVGLAAGGATLVIGGRSEGPLTDQQLLVVTGVAGAGMATVGVGLQITGSALQQRSVPFDQRRARKTRAVAAALGVVGAGAAGVVAWRLLDDRPDGLWLPIAAPVAVVSLLGATGLHTIALLDADAQLEEAQLEVFVGPSGVIIQGRF